MSEHEDLEEVRELLIRSSSVAAAGLPAPRQTRPDRG
jgi:hypothetical protein